jgi:predicted nucleotide-binding protein
MSEITGNLVALANRLDEAAKKTEAAPTGDILHKLCEASERAGRAWSGSSLGYHSMIYYENMEPRPPGAHFSPEWGMMETFSGGTIGTWAEWTFDGVRNVIFGWAGVSSIEPLKDVRLQAEDTFNQAKEELSSLITLASEAKPDAFLLRLKTQTEELKNFSASQCASAFVGGHKLMTRDSLAASQWIKIAPHISVLADVAAVRGTLANCATLGKIARRAASHLQTRERQPGVQRQTGTNVFIGHGRSRVWKELKDFLQDRLELPWDEFNRIPVAGVTNTERLLQMLDQAAIAFMIMTAEDEQPNGSLRARENVVHEAGLFQGRLGFSKAIILLEEGCGEFSNITGLGQIRFPKDNIDAAFEEIRRVLEREGLIEG